MSESNSAGSDRKHYLLLANYVMVLLASLNTDWIGPLIPAISKARDIPLTELGALLSVQYTGCLLTMSLGKKTVDWLGIKGSLVVASTIAGAGFLTFALATSPDFLWFGSLLIGAGTGINAIVGTLVVLRLARENSATALNKVHLFFGLGALLGPLVAWTAHRCGWQYNSAFFFATIASIAILILTVQASELEKRPEEVNAPRSIEILKSPALWLYSLVMFFYVGIESGATAWLFVFLREASKMPHAEASLGMSMLWIGLTASRHFCGRLCQKYPPPTVALSFMLLSALGLLALTINPQLGLFSLGLVALIGFGFGPVFPTVLALVNNRYDSSAALVSTVAITTGFLGGMIFPYSVGKIFEQAGIVSGMGFVTAGAVLMILIFLIIFKKAKTESPQEKTICEAEESKTGSL